MQVGVVAPVVEGPLSGGLNSLDCLMSSLVRGSARFVNPLEDPEPASGDGSARCLNLFASAGPTWQGDGGGVHADDPVVTVLAVSGAVLGAAPVGRRPEQQCCCGSGPVAR